MAEFATDAEIISAAHEFDALIRSMIARSLHPEAIFRGMASSMGSAVGNIFPASAQERLAQLAQDAVDTLRIESSPKGSVRVN